MIPLKSERDLEMLRRAGVILGRILRSLRESVKPGIMTLDINDLAVRLIRDEGVVSAFKGYRGYPAAICTSVNEEIVHGIPAGRRINDGDIISLDVGIQYEGYFSDAAVTVPVGHIDAQKKKLLEVTKRSLAEGIRNARPGGHLGDISGGIQQYAEKHGFSVVRQFVGHGIGVRLHEDPEIPNYGRPHHGALLKSGMVLAIEPMVNMGTWEAEILDNGWTAVTKDRLPSAHFEHTIAVTENGPEILTYW